MTDKPIIKGKFFSPKYSLLRSKPDYASALGRIVAAWSAIDIYCGSLYALLLGASFWKSHVAYSAITSHQARVKTIRDLSSEMQGKDEYRPRLLKVLEQIDGVRLRRNVYAHHAWLISENKVYLMDATRELKAEQGRGIQVKELDDLLSDMIQVLKELAKFINEYSQKYPTMTHSSQMQARLPKELWRLLTGQGRDKSQTPPEKD